jgi:hypothetical protein
METGSSAREHEKGVNNFVYMSTSPGGTLSAFPASRMIIIADLITTMSAD